MPTFEFPKDGYKLLCISGLMDNGNAVWREVGTLTLNKKNQPTISLDVTFNPAGVYRDNPESANVFLTTKERVPYNAETKKEAATQSRESRQRTFKVRNNQDDLGDDIPF